MNIALACYSFKVLGGRERDCLEIARGLAALGHDVTILTTHPPRNGLKAPIRLETLKRAGWSNHGRIAHFADAVRRWREHAHIDAVIGFERLPDLDFYYAAGQPWPQRSRFEMLLPRYRLLAQFEAAVFARGSSTFVFFLAENQAQMFREIYATPEDRSLVLPPTLHPDRRAPETFYGERDAVRSELGIPDNHNLLINVAAYGEQKGLDRIIAALPDVRSATLLSVGMTNSDAFVTMARHAGVADRVRFIGYSDRIDRLIGAADLMVHPARVEATGTVIVESLLYGVPVITSGIAGYADHVSASGAGQVLDEPFQPQDLVAALQAGLASGQLENLRSKARARSAVLAASPGMHGVTKLISETVQRVGG